jgi:hypothetical protein
MKKRTKRNVSTPGELDELVSDRLRQLHFYGSFNDYVNSLVLYDLWAEKPHLLTGPVFANHRKEELPALIGEVIRDYGKPNKTGSFFEHRIEEFVKQKSAKESRKA